MKLSDSASLANLSSTKVPRACELTAKGYQMRNRYHRAPAGEDGSKADNIKGWNLDNVLWPHNAAIFLLSSAVSLFILLSTAMKEHAVNADDLQLAQLGHAQSFERQFSRWTMLGLSFAILNSWTALAASLSLALPSGGPIAVSAIEGPDAAFVSLLLCRRRIDCSNSPYTDFGVVNQNIGS